MNPMRAAFVSLLIVLVAMAAATAAGYGPFVDLLRPGSPAEPVTADSTVGAPLAASDVTEPAKADPATPAPACKFCGKPCPSCPAPPAGSDITVELSLAGAEFNDQPQAELSKLKFEVAASWPGYSGAHEIEVASPRDVPRQKLELGLCTLEVEPLLGAAVVTAGRASSQREWTTKGAYKLTLRDDAGKLMDQRILGPLDAAAAEPQHYTPLDTSRGQFSGSRRDIFEGQVSDFRSVEPLFSYEVIDTTKDSQAALDPAGNVFTYVFPHVRLKLYPRELMLQRRAERLAQRQVRYGWWTSKKEEATSGQGDGWGYADLPSYGGGGACGG